MALDIASVTLVSIFMESVLYGFLIFLFAVSTTIILGRHKSQGGGQRNINKTLLSVSVTMFILATVHVGTDLWRVLDAFIAQKDAPNGGTSGVLANVSTTAYMVKSVAYAVQTLVGDGFMIYRLYLVWNGNKFVCFPMTLTFVASVGVGIATLQSFSVVPADAPVFGDQVHGKQLHNWIASFFSLTIFTNLISTALIAGRIWWVQRGVGAMAATKGRGRLAPAAILIIESGAIYSIFLIILLSLYLSGIYAQYIVLDSVQQVIAIVFSLVIVRVALGVSSEVSESTTLMSRSRNGHISVFHTSTGNASTWQSENADYELGESKFIAVKVTKSTESDAIKSFEGPYAS